MEIPQFSLKNRRHAGNERTLKFKEIKRPGGIIIHGVVGQEIGISETETLV